MKCRTVEWTRDRFAALCTRSSFALERSSFECPKVNVLGQQRNTIGLKKLASLFHPIRTKTKTNGHTLSRATCNSSFDWFTGLSPSFVIGQSDKVVFNRRAQVIRLFLWFGSGFTTI